VSSGPRRALVVADGDVRLQPADADDRLVIAADGGLLKAAAAGVKPDVVVGDFDSVPAGAVEAAEADGVEVIRYPTSKDESDTELAVREAIRRGATEVEIAGALGGQRIDHTLANLLLLASVDIGGSLAIVDGPVTVRVIGPRGPERLELRGAAGDLVSLLALSDSVVGVTTDGLAYPLKSATLKQGPTLGLSNELAGERASVSVERGRLAVIHTRRENP
jgi:thiamine pyrophosphokinase